MKYMSIRESAEYLNISRQMVYHLIKIKRLMPFKVNRRSVFTKEILDSYYDSRWSRHEYFSNDEVSVKEAAAMLKLTPLQFYYIIYRGRIPYKRIGSLYIIKKEDVVECSKNIIKCRSKSYPKATISNTGQKNIGERRKFKSLFTTLPKEQKLSRPAQSY